MLNLQTSAAGFHPPPPGNDNPGYLGNENLGGKVSSIRSKFDSSQLPEIPLPPPPANLMTSSETRGKFLQNHGKLIEKLEFQNRALPLPSQMIHKPSKAQLEQQIKKLNLKHQKKSPKEKSPMPPGGFRLPISPESPLVAKPTGRSFSASAACKDADPGDKFVYPSPTDPDLGDFPAAKLDRKRNSHSCKVGGKSSGKEKGGFMRKFSRKASLKTHSPQQEVRVLSWGVSHFCPFCF